MAKAIASGARSSGYSCVTSSRRTTAWRSHEIDRRGELARVADAHAEHVELLLGEDAEPQRHLLAAHPDLHEAPGRGHDLETGAHRGGCAGRVDDHGRSLAAGPRARLRDDAVGVAPDQRLRADRRAERQARLDEVDREHVGAAIARRERHRVADRAGAEDDDALAGVDAPAPHGAHGDRHRLGERGDDGRRVDREHLCLRDAQALLQAAVVVDADEAEPIAHVGRARRGTGSTGRTPSAATARRARRPPDPAGNPVRRPRSSPRPRGPGRAGSWSRPPPR